MIWVMTIGTPWRHCRQTKNRCDLRPTCATHAPDKRCIVGRQHRERYSIKPCTINGMETMPRVVRTPRPVFQSTRTWWMILSTMVTPRT